MTLQVDVPGHPGQRPHALLFQPIIGLEARNIAGYELQHPENLANFGNQLHIQALQQFSQLQLPGRLFLPLLENDITELSKALAALNISSQRIVLLLQSMPSASTLSDYRAQGFSLGLHAALGKNLLAWVKLQPDYILLDHQLTQGIQKTPRKYEQFQTLLSFADSIPCQLIALAVAHQTELDTLAEAGIQLLQGPLLGVPQPIPTRSLGKARRLLPEAQPSGFLAQEHITLASLLTPLPGVWSQAPIAQVLEQFRNTPELNSIAVLDSDEQPIGILHRHLLSNTLLQPFALEVLGRKPISRLMSQDFLEVDRDTSLEKVSRLITARARQLVEENFIITQDGRYLGLGKVIDVLRLITKLREKPCTSNTTEDNTRGIAYL